MQAFGYFDQIGISQYFPYQLNFNTLQISKANRHDKCIYIIILWGENRGFAPLFKYLLPVRSFFRECTTAGWY